MINEMRKCYDDMDDYCYFLWRYRDAYNWEDYNDIDWDWVNAHGGVAILEDYDRQALDGYDDYGDYD